jgi:flavin reductase (DIM6/NTAB) family NADH-FMN oxidoreductase RutF
VQRDTLQNIMETKVYTLNFVRAAQYKHAHQTSARYDSAVSEFDKTTFSPFYHEGCAAPFVEDAVVKIAMKLEDSIPIPLNGTAMIIGSIMQVDIDDAMVGSDGFVNLSEAEVLISQGLDAYFISKEIGRLPYAKP